VNNNPDPESARFPHKPSWLKVKLPKGENYLKIKDLLSQKNLSTICQSGKCPNLAECWGAGTATFMILGSVCTRNCTFCNVSPGKPLPPDINEPQKVAESVKLMHLKHCVITSVTRDDLPDKGAEHWTKTINEVVGLNPSTTIEVLIPDMKDDMEALNMIIEAKPDIISHNMETVKRLYKTVRPQANYERSLRQIKYTHEAGRRSKSGFMLGLGETEDEIIELIDDLYNHQADILSIGQYLQPTAQHHKVIEFIHPEKFESYANYARNKGIKYVESGPLVRSSYHSDYHLI
jgi:lipoic acid synthetase